LDRKEQKKKRLTVSYLAEGVGIAVLAVLATLAMILAIEAVVMMLEALILRPSP
jgi:hypothetical protein